MEILQNGNGDLRNGHSKSRSRSRSPRRSDDGHNDQEEVKERKHTNGDIYDPTKSDNENNEDESKADVSNGDNIVHADYQSENEETL